MIYVLPFAYQLLRDPPSKEQGKNIIKTKIHQNVEQGWREDIQNKSSLTYINPDSVRVGKVHQIYSSVRNNTFDIRRADVTAKLLTGTYTLQSNKAKFNQFNVNPQCPLCKKFPETRDHFIVVCDSLNDIRTPYLRKVKILFDCCSGINNVIETPELCVQLLLDSIHLSSFHLTTLRDHQREYMELYSREMLYKLHMQRVKLLK